jgi:predicted anti-sigma-YlaC factor YlaD
MHAVVLDSLEEYLTGVLEPAVQRKIEGHLKTCETCREEVAGMQQISLLMGTLKSGETITPPAGFYARVMQEVGDRQPTPAFSSLFALDLAFGRRLAFACLLTLAVLGSYLISRETGEPPILSPEAIMAQQDAPAFDSASAHDAMLATLTSYEP